MSRPFPWYALRVKPKFEKTVHSNLSLKGYLSFLPCYRERRQWTDRVRLIELPLFTGYVFCSLDIGQRLPVLQTPGILHFVSFGHEPAELDEAEMAALQGAAASGAGLAPWPYLKAGQQVRVTQGPMRDLTGILLRIKSDFRLVLSVTLLQRSVAVEIDREIIQPVS